MAKEIVLYKKRERRKEDEGLELSGLP